MLRPYHNAIMDLTIMPLWSGTISLLSSAIKISQELSCYRKIEKVQGNVEEF